MHLGEGRALADSARANAILQRLIAATRDGFVELTTGSVYLGVTGEFQAVLDEARAHVSGVPGTREPQQENGQ